MNKHILGILAVATLGVMSCSQSLLDEPKKGVVSMESFYQTADDAESAAIAAYRQGMKAYNMGSGFTVSWCIAPPLFVLENAPSDDIYYGSGNKDDHVFGLEINEYRPSFTANSASTVGNMYQGFYNMIYACNLVSDHFEYGSDARINRAVAEANVLKAWAHFKLAAMWGNPPLIDHCIEGGDKPGNTPHDDVLKACVDWCLEAAKYLPSKSNVNDGDLSIRLTAEAAYAFAGKAQIYLKDWKGAAESLGKVVSSGKYALVPGAEMHDIFHMAGDGNCEKVFEYNYINNPGNDPTFDGVAHFQVNSSCFWRDIYLPSNVLANDGWGGINPTKEFCEALIANDGIDSYRRKAWILTYDEMLNVMPYASDDMSLRGIKNKNGVFGNAGYWSWKKTPLRTDLIQNNTSTTQQNTMVMRYAEVLLLYAEACANGGGDASKGLAALNEVQKRAGSKHVSSSLSVEEVQNEMRYEMYLEGCRFFDLVRWGKAATVLANQGKSVPTAKDKINEGGSKHELYVTWDSYNETYGFKAGKNEYYPYPYAETSINPNIVQNPGW